MPEEEFQFDMSHEANLARAACAGDEQAFGQLFNSLYGKVHRTVWAMMSDEQAAHDVVQEAWIKAWEKREKFNFQSRFSTWIHRIAIHSALDALRKRKSRRKRFIGGITERFSGRLLNETGPRKDHPDKNLENKELGREIEEAVAALPEDQRTVLVLREYEGYSYGEIASVVGCQPGTVMSRLHLARQKLQVHLKKEKS